MMVVEQACSLEAERAHEMVAGAMTGVWRTGRWGFTATSPRGQAIFRPPLDPDRPAQTLLLVLRGRDLDKGVDG